MRKKMLTMIVLGIYCFIPHTASSQDAIPVVTQEMIQSQLDELLESRYLLDFALSIDSAKCYQINPERLVEDPSGTLVNCVVFTAKGRGFGPEYSRGLVGIYRSPRIIWTSDTVIDVSQFHANEFVTVQDLNGDSQVEIVISYIEPQPSIGNEQWWIVSWDGLSGRFVNATENNLSSLKSLEGGLEIVDLNGDGIMEIVGEWIDDPRTDSTKRITYSWNGQKYGNWPNPPQPTFGSGVPRDRVSVSIHTRIRKVETSHLYQYSVSNSSQSLQFIDLLRIACNTQSISDVKVRRNWESFFNRTKSFIVWKASIVNPNFVRRGESDSSFSYLSTGLPSIRPCYVQGYNGLSYSTNIATSSFRAFAVAPSDPPTPFISKDYLDTLLNYAHQSRLLGWIIDQPTADRYLGYLSSARTHLQQNNIAQARAVLQQVLQDVDADSSNHLTSEAYALIRYNTEYLLSQLPSAPPPGLVAKLVSSSGSVLLNGSLQYYEGSWKDAVNNGDGTFRVNTSLTSLSLRMTYAFGSQTLSNVTVGPDTVLFRTTKVRVRLQNSFGALIDTGSVQYYAGAWRSFGTTVSGIAEMELLPASYTFRMTYAYGSNDKQQNIGTDPVVVFSTVRTDVELHNSQGALIDQGTVQYYAGAWRSFGITAGGIASKELLPANYSFRMTHDYVPFDKAQNISTNSVVSFSTVQCTIRVIDAQNQPVNGATASYYSGAWRTIGPTVNGEIRKELLPTNLTFRIASGGASYDKAQNLATGTVVEFRIP